MKLPCFAELMTHFSVLLAVADERAELAGIRVLVHLDQAAFVELEIKIENNLEK